MTTNEILQFLVRQRRSRFLLTSKLLLNISQIELISKCFSYLILLDDHDNEPYVNENENDLLIDRLHEMGFNAFVPVRQPGK